MRFSLCFSFLAVLPAVISMLVEETSTRRRGRGGRGKGGGGKGREPGMGAKGWGGDPRSEASSWGAEYPDSAGGVKGGDKGRRSRVRHKGRGKDPMPDVSGLVSDHLSYDPEEPYAAMPPKEPTGAYYSPSEIPEPYVGGGPFAEPAASPSLRGSASTLSSPSSMVAASWITPEESATETYRHILTEMHLYPPSCAVMEFGMPITKEGVHDNAAFIKLVSALDYFKVTGGIYDYHLKPDVAAGGFGSVRFLYRTKKGEAGGRPVLIAIKFAHDSTDGESNKVNRNEVAVTNKLAQFPHPNLAQTVSNYVFNSPTGKGGVISVMQGVDGPELFSLVDRGGLIGSSYQSPLVRNGVFDFFEVSARRIINQVLMGIGHMHRHGMTHNDLKLENVMLELERFFAGDTTSVKAIDFGMGVPFERSASTMLIPCSGTPGFLTPEVWKNIKKFPIEGTEEVKAFFEVVPRSNDLFAAGMILWSMLHGMVPMEPTGNPLPLFGNREHVVFARYRISDDCAQVLDALTSPDWLRTAEEVLQLPWFTRPEEELKAQILRNIGNSELYDQSFSKAPKMRGPQAYAMYVNAIKKDYLQVTSDPYLLFPSAPKAK